LCFLPRSYNKQLCWLFQFGPFTQHPNEKRDKLTYRFAYLAHLTIPDPGNLSRTGSAAPTSQNRWRDRPEKGCVSVAPSQGVPFSCKPINFNQSTSAGMRCPMPPYQTQSLVDGERRPLRHLNPSIHIPNSVLQKATFFSQA